MNKKEWQKKNEESKIKVFTFNVKNGGDDIFSEENRRPRILEYSLIMYNHEKFTLKESGDFWLNEDVAADPTSTSTKKGWDARLPRICSWVLLEDNATEINFVVMNTHFDHKGMEARTKSAELILKMADQWDVPVIITGDFNASESSSSYQVLVNGNYDNTKYIANQTMSWATSPGFFDKGTPFGEVIDHIFMRKNAFKVDEYKVITEDYGGGRLSDHYPVMTILTLQ